jgi:hypothetical protein
MAPVAATRPKCFSTRKANVDQVDVRESMKQNQFAEIAQFFCNAVHMRSQYKSHTASGAVYLRTSENQFSLEEIVVELLLNPLTIKRTGARF